LPPPRCQSTPSTPPPSQLQLYKRMSPSVTSSTSRTNQFPSQSPARGTSPISRSGLCFPIPIFSKYVQ
jgi:serine/threonine-protein kinase LATS1/2